jgi:transposase
MPTHKSSDYKLSAVKYYLSHSKNQVQTCKIFGCSERSLMRWVDKYKSTNNITRKKRDYTSYKITNSHISFIKQQLKDDKTITMDELLGKLQTKYPDLTLSRVHLGRVVRDINITLKQTRLRHVPKPRYKKPIVIKNQLKEFYSKVKQYSLDDIICIDETSLNSFMIRRKCYEELGKRCVVKTEGQEVFKKYTWIFVISSKGIIGYEVYKKGGIDSNRIVDFINKFIKIN